MALNPLAFSETVIGNFLKYQMTAYPFQEQGLNEQMKNLLRLDHVRQSPLLKGPYVSLSQTFAMGCAVTQLVDEGCLHPHLSQLVVHPRLYAHQENAIRAIVAGCTTLVSTGTGSGKSECFLYPAISKALKLKDAKVPAGISTVIVYPMNALAEDQLERLRGLLAGSGISFGIYVGKTPDREADVSGLRMKPGSSRADYQQQVMRNQKERRVETIHPCEEVCSREKMRQNGSQPRILLTNVKQLELLLTRGTDAEMFQNASLDYLVFDEAHTFAGIIGSESACLLRRLKAFCGSQNHTVCIATSATIVDADNPEAARDFAARFFADDKDNVHCVTEQYQQDAWKASGKMPVAPANPGALLQQCLLAVEKDGNDDELAQLYRALAGRNVETTLHEALLLNPLAQLLSKQLRSPADLAMLAASLTERVGRNVSEAELMSYLVLGAAANKEGRAVFRPVVHAFVRGIPGAVVTFPSGEETPRLWLSGEDEKQDSGDEEYFPLRIFTCTTCGQHYFIHHAKDYSFIQNQPQGGDICEDETCYWEKMDPENDGKRVILLDKLIAQDDEGDEPRNPRMVNVWLCRHCGAMHDRDCKKCKHCAGTQPLVRLYALRTSTTNPGYLASCLSCKARGGGYRHKEPIREVRAVNVADVHVLAQEIIQHADRKRLLLFADNRQDAAFQAGWMKDHARRFRLAAIIDGILSKHDNISFGDLVVKICQHFDDDEGLSRALLTEVWNRADKRTSPMEYENERRKYLTIQVMRELCLGTRKRVGLESWGRLRVSYDGIAENALPLLALARKYSLDPTELFYGMEGLLDYMRWNDLVYEQEYKLNTKFFGSGDPLLQYGYLLDTPFPKGCKFSLQPDDDTRRMLVFHKEREQTFSSMFQKWGIDNEAMPDFKKDVWELMLETKILVPVTLLGQNGRPLGRCSGLYQLDLTKLRLHPHVGYYKCRHCSRKTLHKTPHNRCLAWRCQGKLEYIAEPADNYDLHVLKQGYALLRPEEHTAMVPHEKREYIENCFKSDSANQVNTLVCTPTLELGVDIGGLDCTLMRNVPPLPANYWQRVGRAGRRNRMAVNITYCRPASYDKAYYEEPLKMLDGRIDPPAFNLRNANLVEKHVHALILTTTNKLIYGEMLPPEEQRQLKAARDAVFPPRINHYLFDSNSEMRQKPYEFKEFAVWLEKYHEHFLAAVSGTFASHWPEDDSEVVSSEILTTLIQEAPNKMGQVARRLFRRLHWANHEIKRLEKLKANRGTFDNKEDEAHWWRCDRLIKKYKGLNNFDRGRRYQQGSDDISTYGVLAAEGFLPGYGLDSGSVCASGEMPYNAGGGTIELPRPTAMALREYVPGNLLYANGQKFVPRHYMLTTGEDVQEKPTIAVDRDREAVLELSAGAPPPANDMTVLPTIYICDVVLAHQRLISAEEENRFQMPVMHYAIEKNRHNGGQAYSWGTANLQWRKNVLFRMFNAGTPGATNSKYGYLVCQICGHSISPLSSKEAIAAFEKGHNERCGRKPEYVGFYADVSVDCLKLADCAGRSVAYSLMEALRLAATQVLDMHQDDLQIMVTAHYDRDLVDAYLWDPMPGGSGLLIQILENMDQICETAVEILAACSANCEKSCVNCLQTFRNAFYHRYLDRHIAVDLLRERLGSLHKSQVIPATARSSQGSIPDNAKPSNQAEQRLKQLMERAGLLEGEWQHQIHFKTPIEDFGFGSSTPDVFFAPDDADDENDRGCCVYLDGMSAAIHGNPDAQAKDRAIREKLRAERFTVIEITVHDLDDKDAMCRHFGRIARYIDGREFSNRLKNDTSWFT